MSLVDRGRLILVRYCDSFRGAFSSSDLRNSSGDTTSVIGGNRGCNRSRNFHRPGPNRDRYRGNVGVMAVNCLCDSLVVAVSLSWLRAVCLLRNYGRREEVCMAS